MANFEQAVITGGIVLTYILIDAGIRLAQEHIVLKVLLFNFGMWMSVGVVGLMQEVADFNTGGADIDALISQIYLVDLWAAVLTTIYFVLWLVWKNFSLVIKVAAALGMRRKL